MTDRDRLIELFSPFADGTYNSSGTIVDGTKVDDIVDHLLANGVIVPPCKVGTKVYDIALGKIYEWDIASYIIDGEGLSFINVAYMEGNNLCCNTYRISDIGKTVFLTKEEAEEKLKELNNNA